MIQTNVIKLPCILICFLGHVGHVFENHQSIIAILDGTLPEMKEDATLVVFYAKVKSWNEETKKKVLDDFSHIAPIKYIEYLPQGIELNSIEVCYN